MNQDTIQKSYYQQLLPSHYLDVKYSDSEWRIAKIIDKDKKYAIVKYDGYDAKQQQIYMGSYRVAPIRAHSENYTGSTYRANRKETLPICEYKNHLEILNNKYLNSSNYTAFEVNQYLRAQLFVHVHSLITLEDVSIEDCQDVHVFFMGFIQFVGKMAKKVKKEAAEYFQAYSPINKYLYLANEKVALTHSLIELTFLLNTLLRIDPQKLPTIFKSTKHLSCQTYTKYISNNKQYIQTICQLFKINDSSGKWLPFSLRKNAYRFIRKFNPKFKLPRYGIRDFSEVFVVYPFMMRFQQNQKFEEEYLDFIVVCLKEQSPFQAKLKAIQELKKIVDQDVSMQSLDEKKIYETIHQKEIIDHMLSQFHFNAEIFKRFVPLLDKYCKYKSIKEKNIQALFKLIKNRHQSEVALIYEIICRLADLIQTDALDTIYFHILKIDINNEQALSFIKTFTINSVINYSRQKSFFGFFKKSKCSSKYNFYGLHMFYKQLQDGGRIQKQLVIFTINLLKQIFTNELFHSERFNFLEGCVLWLDKKTNFGQSLKLMDCIISTFPTTTIFSDNRREIIEKLDKKQNLLALMIAGIKEKKNIVFDKISYQQYVKYFFEFIENYGDYLKNPIKIEQIEFLWKQQQIKHLCDFLRKSKPECTSIIKKKYMKKLDLGLQEQILKKLLVKKSFFQRKLTMQQFQALQQIFLSYNFVKKNIEISDRGFIRYLKHQFDGQQFFFEFINKTSKLPICEKIIKRTIEVFLRPKQMRQIEIRVKTWKYCLLKLVNSLKHNPQMCLKAINIFLEAIEGKMLKQINISGGNIEVLVCQEHIQKYISIAKNCTIFYLRKLIMKAFAIETDFSLYNHQMKRQIDFSQQQQFSINAMPLEHKGKAISIVARKKERHPHFIALEAFKKNIEKQEELYNIIFNDLSKQHLKNLFWKTVQILPINNNLVHKIQNCDQFTKKQWKQLLNADTNQGLQYNIKIIFNLMGKKTSWIKKFENTGGLEAVEECLETKINQKSINEGIVNKCSQIILKTISNIDRSSINVDKLATVATAVLKKLTIIFCHEKTADEQQKYISIQSLNNLLKLNYSISKVLLKQSGKKQQPLPLATSLKMLEYGVTLPKDKHTSAFLDEHFQSYIFEQYKSLEEKQQILRHFINLLDIEYLEDQKSCELLFVFLIDFMNSFIAEEEELLYKDKWFYKKIGGFVDEALHGNFRDTPYKYNQILYGVLKILNFTITNKYHQYDLPTIFDILLNQFLFYKNQKKIKNQVTLKLLYQNIKKLLFHNVQYLQKCIEVLEPRLQNNVWRKNTMMSWSIQPQKQQKSIFCGLQNLGATCYINCLFQQIFMCRQFRDKFLQINSKQFKLLLQENQIYQLQLIFASLKYSNKRSVSTKKFCDSYITYEGTPINPMIQSDADEFLHGLMEKLQSFTKQNHMHHIIEDTFEGKLSNQLNCEGCPHNSDKEENFLSIGVNIRGKKCLQEALEGFVEGQVLDGDNAYFCEICQKKVRTMKRLCLKQLPNILVIVLKRFEFNYDSMKKIKINDYLSFPQSINMKKYTSSYLLDQPLMQDKNYEYNIRGTVIHSGTSEGGHYYSFIKQSKKWYMFNDEFIEEINVKKIEEDGFGGQDKDAEGEHKFEKLKNAYILIYEKAEKVQRSKSMIESQEQIQSAESIMSENSIKLINAFQQQELSGFEKQLKEQIIKENQNADFLSVILDGNFVRLCQNFIVMNSYKGQKFILLYFFTVVLRDKNKEQHLPSYYRMISDILKKKQIAQWFINQVDHNFMKEFCIEAPRFMRFLCTGIILNTIKKVDQVPRNFVLNCLKCIQKKQGMTPFAKIFKLLSQNESSKNILQEFSYPQRILGILKQNNSFEAVVPVERTNSYFGQDCPDKQKDCEFCTAALCQSLKNFHLSFNEAHSISEKYFSREGSKSLGFILAKETTKQSIQSVLQSYQNKIIKITDFRRDQIEKYLFYVRELCLIKDEDTWRIEKCVTSLKNVIETGRDFYDPLELIFAEIVKIAKKSEIFQENWKQMVQDKQNIEFNKTLRCWLKEVQRPLIQKKTQQFKKRIINMNYQQKSTFEYKNKIIQQNRLEWMIEKQKEDFNQISSDLQDDGITREVTIRTKKIKIKEHFGLIKRVQFDGQEKWGFLEKSQFDIYYYM